MTSEGSRAPAASGDRVILLLIFAAALALRLVYFIQSEDNPLLYTPILDEAYYIELGKAIAGGHLLGASRAFFMDPLYGYFLGAIFVPFGDNLAVVRIVQIALDAFNVILIYAIGARVWNARAAIIAAALWAVYEVAFFYPLLILKTTGTVSLCLLFTLAAIRSAQRGRAVSWFWLGVFGAALTWFRANLMLMGPLALLAYWFADRPNARTYGRFSTLFIIGFLVTLSLGAARNWWVGGEFMFLNSQSGRLLYASNNPDNPSGRYSAPPFSRRHPVEMEIDFHNEAERRLGRSLSAKEVSRYWTRMTFANLAARPGAMVDLLYNKLKGTVGNYEIPVNHSVDLAARFSPLVRAPFPTFAFALALGVPGLVLGLARSRKVIWTLPPVITTLVTVLLFYTSSRFRLPMVPALLIGAGIFIAALGEWVARKEWTKAAIPLVCAVALAAVSVAASDPKRTGDQDYLLARAYWNVNALGRARAIALEAARTFPAQSRFQVLLGMVALSENDLGEAVRRNLAAIGLNPADAEAYHNLGLAYLGAGRHSDAIEAIKKSYALAPRPRSLFTLAKAYDTAGRTGDAITAYREYLRTARPAASLRTPAMKRLVELGAGGDF